MGSSLDGGGFQLELVASASHRRNLPLRGRSRNQWADSGDLLQAEPLPHVVLLEDLTHQLAAGWLTERHRRPPAAINPHLIISQQSALDINHPPVSASMFKDTFARAGLTVQQVRQDRILFEARQHADPLHLMRLFGLSDGAATRYVTAAHPERTAEPPR